MTTDIFELFGSPEATRLMKEAFERAAAENRRLGLPAPVLVNGEWLAMYPDGRLETIVRPGTKPEARGTITEPLAGSKSIDNS